MRLNGGKDSLGFLFFYELMTGTLKTTILPGDSGHTLASLLIRMLPAEETQEAGLLMSMLRAMMLNMVFTAQMPHFQDDRKLKLATMFKGQSVISNLMQKVTGAPHNAYGLSSDKMASITSDCSSMCSPSIKWP